MKKKAFVEIFYKNAGYVAVVLISLVYITSSLIRIQQTGRTVGEIIATGVLSMIVGILINGIFRSIGIQRGESDERTVATEKLHSDTVDDIAPYIDKLDEYCESETKREVKKIRCKILAREGLSYNECFDDDGVSKEPILDASAKKTYRKKMKAYKKAVNLSIKPLTASNLTAEGANADDPFNFGKTKKQYTTGQNATDLIIRAIMAIVFGYFGVTLVSEVDVASIIWNTLQIIMYVAGGVMQMYMSCMWLINDYRHNKIRKIDILQKFKAYAEAKKEEKEEIPQSPTATAPFTPGVPQNEKLSLGVLGEEPEGECMENVGNN